MEFSGIKKEQEQTGAKKKPSRLALGRGLEALIPVSNHNTVETEPASKKIINIEINRIKQNPHQPRTKIDEESLAELTESIKEKGIIQPVIVRKVDDGYELIAGERRTRAAKKAGLDMVPAIIYNVGDEESLIFALIENIQRQDLNPLELANAYQMLMDEFNLTQEQVSARVGKERASVANYLRLRNLPQSVKQFISEGKLSFGHAKALMMLNKPEEQEILASLVVKEGLSVRECESLALKKAKNQKKRRPGSNTGQTTTIDFDIKDLEEKLQQTVGTKVRIRRRKRGGVIEIEYYTLDEFDGIMKLLGLKID